MKKSTKSKMIKRKEASKPNEKLKQDYAKRLEETKKKVKFEDEEIDSMSEEEKEI